MGDARGRFWEGTVRLVLGVRGRLEWAGVALFGCDCETGGGAGSCLDWRWLGMGIPACGRRND